MKQLFLSFSVADDIGGRDFVRQLFDRLQQQEVDPWVFESSSGEIATGMSISDACRRKIEEADIFVVFINDDALKSDYVGMEVSHALWDAGRRSLPIVPLIATQILRNKWPPAIAEATGFKGIVLPPRPLEAVESVVIHVCERIQIDYRPPSPTNIRLPLRKRLSDELQTKHSLSTYKTGDFIAVLRKCDLTVEAMAQEDYAKARRILEALLTDLELDYGINDPYYPRIVYGAVLLAEAQAHQRSFNDAEKYFGEIIAQSSNRLDANAFAARANALMELGRFEEALVDYYAAESYLESPDAALFYNMIRARVLGGLSMDRAEIRRRRAALDNGIVTRIPGDLARLTSSLSLAYAYVGDTETALNTWRGIRDWDSVLPEVVVDIGNHLHRHAIEHGVQSDLDAVNAVISQYIGCRTDLSDATLLPLNQLWSRVLFDMGDRHRARLHLATLIDRFAAMPVLKVDAAMFALADGDITSARQLCEAVVSLNDHSQCHPPVSSREFNFSLGHAFWLLGRQPEAKESFRRSEYSSSLWYEITMPQEFGSVC